MVGRSKLVEKVWPLKKIVEMDGIWRIKQVRAVRQYFVDGERQRYWPLGWGDEIDSLEDGDRFIIELGEKVPRPW